MKPMYVAALSLTLIASPAMALRITNLDKVPHTVQLSGSTVDQRTIQPGETEYFTGASHGQLSVVPAPVLDKRGKPVKQAAKHQSNLRADGMLSGVIGNESDVITADPNNDYAIWQDGKIRIQSGKHNRGSIF